MTKIRASRRIICLATLLLLAIPSLGQQPAAAPVKGLPLPDRLAAHLDQPRFARGVWGVKILSLDTGRTVFERNAGKLFQPASNAKLYSGALALDRLGPDFRIRTSLYAENKPDTAGTLKGDLIVFGRGDPSAAVRFEGVTYTNLLDPLAKALAAAGVKRITGDLVGDESFFRGPPFGSGWCWDDLQYYYGAEVSALTVQDNVVDLWCKPAPQVGTPCAITPHPDLSELVFDNRTTTAEKGARRTIDVYRPVGQNLAVVTGQMSVEDKGYWEAASVNHAGRWYLLVFREALARQGIMVAGGLRTVDWLQRDRAPIEYTKLVELGFIESRPVADLVTKMMKPSQNLYAQLLLLQVGARQHAPENKGNTSEALGLEEMGRFLAEAGVPKGEALLEEGSGLSRGTRLTPNATVTLLRHMARHRCFDMFRSALPIAGTDGSLKARMKGTAADANARAKTGSFRFVNTLSGYVSTKAAESLAFCLMLNGYEGSSARSDLDAIVVMLAEEGRPENGKPAISGHE